MALATAQTRSKVGVRIQNYGEMFLQLPLDVQRLQALRVDCVRLPGRQFGKVLAPGAQLRAIPKALHAAI